MFAGITVALVLIPQSMAYAQLAREEYAWARRSFEEALVLDPEHEDGLAGLGETLLRFGHTWTGQKTLPATPEGLGPECDKLNKRGIQAHFDHVMKRMVELAGPEAGKTFHTFFVDRRQS